MGKSKSFTKHCDVSGYINFKLVQSFGPGTPIISSGSLWTVDADKSLVSSITYGDNYHNWLFLLRDGQQATTTLDGTIFRAARRVGHLDARVKYHHTLIPDFYSDWSYVGHGVFSSEPLFSSTTIPSSSATAENRALVRFNAKAAEVNRQFQGGVFFAELHKTLHGLRHPAEALFKGIGTYANAATKLRRSFVKDKAAYQALSRSQRRKVAKAFSEAATGLWLEKSFHWLPLYYDIQGALSSLEHTFDRMPSEFVKVSANDVQQASSSQTSGGVGFISLNYSVSEKSGASARMYGRVRVRPRLPYMPDTAALGFDLRSFVPTLWELIPYSWAVDYFTNIGDIIYGMSQGGCDVEWAAVGVSRYVRRALIASPTLTADPPPFNFTFDHHYCSGSPSGWSSEKAIIHRAPYNGLFVPELEWKVPGLSLKWLNLGAAFLQRSLGFL
jgi:hypothetical protein